jgi:uncharacterized protein (DUF2062 family)
LTAWKSENASPVQVGLGFALGVFIGIVPSFAVGSFVALYTAGKLGWNQGAALSGTFLMNPVKAPFFYGLSYVVGSGIAGVQQVTTPAGLLDSLQHVGWAYLLGIVLVALIVSMVTGLVAFLAAYHAANRKTNLPPLRRTAVRVLPPCTKSYSPASNGARI